MNFNRRGWISEYMRFRSENPLPAKLPSFGVRVVEDTSVHNDIEQAIYYFLEPTGLLYGSLLNSPFPNVEYPRGRYFDSLDRVHMVFLESLFACLVADRHFLLQDLVEEKDHFNSTLGVAMSYFLNDPRYLGEGAQEEKKRRWFSGNGGRNRRRLEKELKRRITRGALFFYRPELFYNSFLFLDLYSCLLWQRTTLTEMEPSHDKLESLERQQTEWRIKLIRYLIAASQSDGLTQPTERRLINHFIKSSGLPRDTRAELRRLMKSGVSVPDLQVEGLPWLVRRYILELVLMTVMVDQVITDSEQAFVEVIVEMLGLWQEEMHQSVAVLELFLIEHQDRLNYLKNRSHLLSIRDRIQERAGIMLRKNLDSLVNEIKETRELYALLMKATKTSLSEEEKKKVRDQLADILKTIPALAVFALPGGGIILPVLIKLLPFNILPSSFED